MSAGQAHGVSLDPHRDDALEAEISHAAMRLATAPTSAERRDAWNALCELQGQRSAERIRRMEIERGLRR